MDRREPGIRSLRWSIAVVFVGGVIAAFTTPTASGRTVIQQRLGLAVPAEEVVDGSLGGLGSAPGGGPVAQAAAAGPAAASPASAPQAAAASAAPTTAAKAKAASAAATTATAAPAAAKAAAPKLQPDAGSYPLGISGTSSVDGKASRVPASGSLVVEQRGSDQQHRTVGVPGGLVLLQRASVGGVDLVSFSLSAGPKTLTFRPPSPVAYVRTEPGASWSWTARSSDGSVGVRQTASVTSGGSMTVDGTAVPTVIVQRAFTVSGTVQGTVRLTSTVSQVDRLPLRQHQAIDVKATALGLLSTRVVSDATATLTSTRPR